MVNRVIGGFLRGVVARPSPGDLASVIRVTPLGAGLTAINAVLLTFAFWNERFATTLAVWCVATIAISVLVFLRSWRLRNVTLQRVSRKASRTLLCTSFALALPWVAMLVIVVPDGTDRERLVALLLCGGMMAGAVVLLQRALAASMVYLGSLSLAVVVGSLIGDQLWAVIVYDLVYTVALMLGAYQTGETARDRDRALERLLDANSELEAANKQISASAERERMAREAALEAADELARHRDHLQELVDDRTRIIADQAEELQLALDTERRLNGMQRQFVSMVCHEFRTPLAIIDGNAQRILRKMDSISRERKEDGLTTIRKSVIRLIDLMESVLSSARLEAGTIAYKPRWIDPRQMLSELLSNFSDLHPERAIYPALEALPGEVFLDENLVRQLVTNLVSNAIKYSTGDSAVWVTGASHDGSFSISVRDQGVGIAPDEVDRLFERFFRASTSAGIAGTGIGLHLAKAIAEMHGGTMSVESTVGEGSTFSVTLPVRGRMPASSEAEEHEAAQPTPAVAAG